MQNLFDPLIKIYKALYLFAYDITGNYGISLVLLSLFTFIVLYPFTKKAQHIQNKEHRIQSVLGPQIESIKKHYSGREQYEQLQWLYRRYSYHPLYAIRSALGFVFQIPFLTTAYYMLSGLSEIQDVSWGIIPNLGAPDHLLNGINILPFVMTLVTVVYAFVMPGISKKERMQTVGIGVFFLVLLYAAPSALLIFWTCNLIWSLLDSLLSEKLAWVGEYISENELAIHIIFALAVTVGILVPTEIYIKNASQLWFSYQDILKYFLSDTAKYFCALFLIYLFFRQEKSKNIYLSVLLGILVAIFLQSFIIGLDYGTFDGHRIEWEKYTKLGIANAVVWLVCIVESFIRFSRLKFVNYGIKKLVKPLTFGIVVIQCVALMHTIIMNGLPSEFFNGKKFINLFTTKNMFDVSTNHNIIVFLLDAFDASIFETMMTKELEIIEGLKGFTFYPDTTSVYGYTHNSIPQIITGKIYRNDIPHSEYLKKAWSENPYHKFLQEQKYNVGIYTTEQIANQDAPIVNLIHGKVALNDNIMQDFKNLVMFRIFPHFLKKIFYYYNPNMWNQLFENNDVQLYATDDRYFYLRLKEGIKEQSDSNCFRFYHLAGAHHPYILNRNIEPLPKDIVGTQYEQAVGSMKIVLEYIRQMKKLQIFDASTFVIMADHGYINKIGGRPLFCIKGPKTANSKLKVSDRPVSFSQFMPIVLSSSDGASQIQISFLADRVFYLQKDRDLIEYVIKGNAKDVDSWKKGRTLRSWYQKHNNLYALGEKIDCSEKNLYFEGFQGKGWYVRPHPTGTYTIGPETELILRIKDYHGQKLKFSFRVITYLEDLPFRKLKIYANEKFVSEQTLDNKKFDFSVTIPPLENEENLLRIRFNIDNSDIASKHGIRNAWGMFMEYFQFEEIVDAKSL